MQKTQYRMGKRSEKPPDEGTVGGRIRIARLALKPGWTPAYLSDLLGHKTTSRYTNWEGNENGVPSMGLLEVAFHLDANPAYLHDCQEPKAALPERVSFISQEIVDIRILELAMNDAVPPLERPDQPQLRVEAPSEESWAFRWPSLDFDRTLNLGDTLVFSALQPQIGHLIHAIVEGRDVIGRLANAQDGTFIERAAGIFGPVPVNRSQIQGVCIKRVRDLPGRIRSSRDYELGMFPE